MDRPLGAEPAALKAANAYISSGLTHGSISVGAGAVWSSPVPYPVAECVAAMVICML